MRNEILRQLQSEYEQQRMNNMQEENARRMHAEQLCPELGALLDERQALIYRGLRGILGGTAQAEDLPLRMQVMNDRIASLLRQNDLPADYLEPVYRCRRCHDTGYVGETVREM